MQKDEVVKTEQQRTREQDIRSPDRALKEGARPEWEVLINEPGYNETVLKWWKKDICIAGIADISDALQKEDKEKKTSKMERPPYLTGAGYVLRKAANFVISFSGDLFYADIFQNPGDMDAYCAVSKWKEMISKLFTEHISRCIENLSFAYGQPSQLFGTDLLIFAFDYSCGRYVSFNLGDGIAFGIQKNGKSTIINAADAGSRCAPPFKTALQAGIMRKHLGIATGNIANYDRIFLLAGDMPQLRHGRNIHPELPKILSESKETPQENRIKSSGNYFTAVLCACFSSCDTYHEQ